jgi:DnaJ-class molecular chaperone
MSQSIEARRNDARRPTCFTCGGTGKIAMKCPECHGSGKGRMPYGSGKGRKAPNRKR